MKYLIGTLIGLALYPIIPDVAELIDDRYETNYWVKVGVPSYNLSKALTGRCTNTIRPSGVSNRQYFGCGKISIFISDKIYGDEQ